MFCVPACVCVRASASIESQHISLPMANLTLPEACASLFYTDKCTHTRTQGHTHTHFHITVELIKHNVPGLEQDREKEAFVCAVESCRVLSGRETGGSTLTASTQRTEEARGRGEKWKMCERKTEKTSRDKRGL